RVALSTRTHTPMILQERKLAQTADLGAPRVGSTEDLSDGCCQRPLGVAIVVPRLVLAQERQCGPHREALRLKPPADLTPVERHRDRGARARAWRERSDCCR